MPTITTTIFRLPRQDINQDSAINHLLNAGVIERTLIRGRYFIADVDAGSLTRRTFRRDNILTRFAVEQPATRYTIDRNAVRACLENAQAGVQGATAAAATTPPQARRTIQRYPYHRAPRRPIGEYLARIQPDADGVVRSFGIEYEVYSLNSDQEDKLARLLDTLPDHINEMDGSLGNNGVEIIFYPVGAADFIHIIKTLGQFIIDNNVPMGDYNNRSMAGMHITYGVSNSTTTRHDLQIRLNRIAFTVAAVATQVQIRKMFGRTFGNYRSIPASTTFSNHSNAFSNAGRHENCWECRLPAWNCEPEKMIEFFRATEFAFHRPYKVEDMLTIVNLFGTEEVDGE